MLANGVYTLQTLIVLALSIAALAVEVWAFVDALRQRAGAFVAAGKLTKTKWLLILGVALAFGVLGLPPAGSFLGSLLFINIVAVVAAAVYLTDVRPAVRQTRGGGGRSGPYGPW
jgi:hypothetical protein